MAVLERKARRAKAKKPGSSRYVCPSTFDDFAPQLKIRSGVDIIPFTPYWFQKRIVRAINKYPKTLIVKSRQQGITETVLGEIARKTIENRGFLATVYAKSQDDTSEFADRAKLMVEDLYKKGLVLESDNKLEFNVVGGGKTLFRNSKPSKARSIPSVALAFYDEAAFSDGIAEIVEASAPSQTMLGDRARSIFVSSPNGVGTWFYDQMVADNPVDILELIESVRAGEVEPYQEVVDNNGNCKIILHWRAHPIFGADPDYLHKEAAKSGMSWDKILQEYDLDHSQSEEVVFRAELVTSCLSKNQDEDAGLMPELEDCDMFFLGVDVSGEGDDYTVAKLLGLYRGKLYEMRDGYRKHDGSSHYDVEHIDALIKRFNPTKTLVEKNNGGHIYLEDLISLNPDANIEGFYTSNSSKPNLIGRLKITMEKNILVLDDKSPAYGEISIYRKFPDGSMGAPRGGGKKKKKYDDCVIAIALASVAAHSELGNLETVRIRVPNA